MANFGNVLTALQGFIKAVMNGPNAIAMPVQQRNDLKATLDAYIDARIDEKLKQHTKKG